MFNMVDFLKSNLINGYWNNSFSEQQVNLFAMSYLMKGMIKQEDFDRIMKSIEPPEPIEETQP